MSHYSMIQSVTSEMSQNKWRQSLMSS